MEPAHPTAPGRLPGGFAERCSGGKGPLRRAPRALRPVRRSADD
jgi:hypothetical protein